jgi:outer membrane protein assembly factor BamB
MHSTPALAANRIYIGSQDHRVYCVNASTGALLWTYLTGGPIYSSPTITAERLYIGSDDGSLYCLNAVTGAVEWRYTTGRRIVSVPAVAHGRVVVGSADHSIYCLDAVTGAKLWQYATGNTVLSSPTIVQDAVVIGSVDGYVYCLTLSSGDVVWRFQASTGIYASPALHAHRVFIGDVNGYFYCLQAETGALLWTYQTKGKVAASPAVADETVYVASWGQPGHPAVADGILYSLNASTGALLWRYRMEDRISSSPAIAQGKLVVGGFDGRVYCFADVYEVTFSHIGVASDVTGTVVTVDSVDYSVTDLPHTFRWTRGSDHTFAFASPLETGSDTQYVWIGTAGLSTLQRDTLILVASGRVIARYQTRAELIHELTHVLRDTITTWNVKKGTERSLLSKLDAALQLFATGDDNGAVDKLKDFRSYVEAQQRKKLTEAETVQLLAAAQRIIALLSL